MTRLLGVAGATRTDSSNAKLVREAARLFGEAEFAMGDIRMPLYDGDDEEASGIPPEAQRLIGQIREADGLIISTPEYNHLISGVLKNAIDWVSRDRPVAFLGKPIAVMSASAGRFGGIRGQMALRQTLGAFQPKIVVGPQVYLGDSRNAFDDAGRLKNEDTAVMVTKLMKALRQAI